MAWLASTSMPALLVVWLGSLLQTGVIVLLSIAFQAVTKPLFRHIAGQQAQGIQGWDCGKLDRSERCRFGTFVLCSPVRQVFSWRKI